MSEDETEDESKYTHTDNRTYDPPPQLLYAALFGLRVGTDLCEAHLREFLEYGAGCFKFAGPFAQRQINRIATSTAGVLCKQGKHFLCGALPGVPGSFKARPLLPFVLTGWNGGILLPPLHHLAQTRSVYLSLLLGVGRVYWHEQEGAFSY